MIPFIIAMLVLSIILALFGVCMVSLIIFCIREKNYGFACFFIGVTIGVMIYCFCVIIFSGGL